MTRLRYVSGLCPVFISHFLPLSQFTPMRPYIYTCSVLCLLCGIVANRAEAEDFRVNNAVYQGDNQSPTSRSVTIFQKDMVFDCMPDETVVFNKTTGQIMLLNRKNLTRTELTTKDVDNFVKQLPALVAAKGDKAGPLLKFLITPKFLEQFDTTSQVQTFSSPMVVYRLTLSPQPTSDAMVDQYREFCDWSAKLNAMLSSGGRPPFARIHINEVVAKRKAIASQVLLTIQTTKAEPTTIRSTHQINAQLTPADLQGLAKINEAMTEYKLVTFEQYRKADEK